MEKAFKINNKTLMQKLIISVKKYWFLYLIMLFALTVLFIYAYVPMFFQLMLSFTDYRILDGIFGSRWVWFDNFKAVFAMPRIGQVIKNTLYLSALRFIFGFFPPLILAVFLFDIHNKYFKRVSQTIVYIPYFFSWVIIYSISWGLFSYDGIFSSLITVFGGERENLLANVNLIRTLLISTSVWKNMGWGTIIYLAAMTAIPSELFDAARVDGCGPVRRIFVVTLPSIMNIVAFLGILAVGNILRNIDSEQILQFYTPGTYIKIDVIDTWVYRVGYREINYSIGAALAFLQSTISLVLILLANHFSGKYAKVSIW